MEELEEVLQSHVQSMRNPAIFQGNPSIPLVDNDRILKILSSSISILSEESNILELNGPICIIGNISGSLFSLYKIFNQFGLPPQTRYLFLGNFVGVHDFSFDCLLLVLTLKTIFPRHIFIIRGVNEFVTNLLFKRMRRAVTFNQPDYWFSKLFIAMPLAAIVSGSFFCSNYSIPTSLDDLIQYDRKTGSSDLKMTQIELQMFTDNNNALMSSEGFIDEFLYDNDIKMIIRSDNNVRGGLRSDLNGKIISIYSGIADNDISVVLVAQNSDSIGTCEIENIKAYSRDDVKYINLFSLKPMHKTSTLPSIIRPNLKAMKSVFVNADPAISLTHPIHSQYHSFQRLQKITRLNTNKRVLSSSLNKTSPLFNLPRPPTTSLMRSFLSKIDLNNQVT